MMKLSEMLSRTSGSENLPGINEPRGWVGTLPIRLVTTLLVTVLMVLCVIPLMIVIPFFLLFAPYKLTFSPKGLKLT